MSQVQRMTFADFNSPMPEWNEKTMAYLVFQQEMCPTTQKLHWQGYVEFITRRNLNALAKLLHPSLITKAITGTKKREAVPAGKPLHIKALASRGTAEQNLTYCSKSESSVEGSFHEYGTPIVSHQGERTDMATLLADVKSGLSNKQLFEKNPTYIKYTRHIDAIRASEMEVTYTKKDCIFLYGDAGAGKGKYLFDNYSKDGVAQYYTAKIEGDKIWFDFYQDQDVIVVDDFTPHTHKGTVQNDLMVITDRPDVQVRVKGGFVQLKHHTVIVTSNYPPPEYAAFYRRFNKVLKFADGKIHDMSKFIQSRISELNANRRSKDNTFEKFEAWKEKQHELAQSGPEDIIVSPLSPLPFP